MANGTASVVDAIKATAEMCGIFMKHAKEQGFSQKEALALTQTFLQETLKPKPKTKNEEEK